MSSNSVLDQIGVFFGGAYQPQFKYYGTAQIPGLGVVRRGKPKDDDRAQYYLGMVDGTESGSILVIRIGDGAETRVAMAGATSGAKKVSHSVELHFFVVSTARDVEDVEDYTRDLLDAARDRIHGDRTCGSSGLENGGFQVGEDYDGPGSPVIEWTLSEVETSAGLSKQKLVITMSASEYIEA